jgi:hypothetical protein
MAIKHYADNSGNSDYTTPTYTDLDSLAPIEVALTGGSSMSAGNTISETPPFAAPGSVPANPPMKGMQPDNTDLDVGTTTSYTHTVEADND